jgi:hypothetical protein
MPEVVTPDGRTVVFPDGMSESDMDAALRQLPPKEGPSLVSRALDIAKHPLSSVIPPSARASVSGAILGREVPVSREATPDLSTMATEAKAHPFKTAGSVALSLSQLPAL